MRLPSLFSKKTPWWHSEAFARVGRAYDLERLSQSCVVFVGLGGFLAGAEELIRCGIGRAVAIDGDRVSTANLATQQVYRSDVSKPKAAVFKRRAQRINPKVKVIARPVRIEEITDSEFERLVGLHDSPPPLSTVIIGMTDSFAAQARINRLALNYSFGSVCAQMYREGRAGEVTCTYPGLTSSCHRCLLASRYSAYLEQGYKNDVTSDGSPISSTVRLNSIAVFLTLALLHHGTGHPRWGQIAERLGQRNLVQVRMHPDADLPGFNQVLNDGGERMFCDESVWWAGQPADGSDGGRPCPDCGGTGDLRDARGTFADSRLMR